MIPISGHVREHFYSDNFERRSGDSAAFDQEHASGQEGNSETDFVLGRAIQRRQHGPRQLHPAAARRSSSRLPTMLRADRSRAGGPLHDGDDRQQAEVQHHAADSKNF